VADCNEAGGGMHVSSNPAIWYAARASGVAAYVVLSLVVMFGLTLGGKAQNRRWPRFSVEDIHRFGGLLVGSLIGVHVLAIAADAFLPFSLVQLLVPFTSTYRPLWTGLGIAAAEILLALAITNHYRKRLNYSFWRKAHYLNFAVWGLASVHGLMAGTDRGASWLAILYGVSVAGVVMLLVWRFGGYVFRSPRVAGVGAITVVALPLLIIGPLRHAPPAWNAANVNENLTGSVIRNGTNLQQIVSFVGQGSGREKLLVRADLLVAPGRLEKTSLQLEYLPSGDVCRGRVTNVAGTSFSGSCHLPDGAHRTIQASWVPNAEGTGVVGQITLSA
jgi:sulfoxide reductase heme-binding subunit YedZ